MTLKIPEIFYDRFLSCSQSFENTQNEDIFVWRREQLKHSPNIFTLKYKNISTCYALAPHFASPHNFVKYIDVLFLFLAKVQLQLFSSAGMNPVWHPLFNTGCELVSGNKGLADSWSFLTPLQQILVTFFLEFMPVLIWRNVTLLLRCKTWTILVLWCLMHAK